MMTKTPSKANWQKLIDVANRDSLEYGFGTTRPATQEEIDSLIRRAAQQGLEVDKDFLTFLRYANGINCNGLTIPRAEKDPSPNSLDDFLGYNDRKSFIGIGSVYGNMDDTYYVLYPDGKFRRLGAGDEGCVLSTYDTFSEMVTAALAEAVGPSVRDSDSVAEIYESLPTTPA